MAKWAEAVPGYPWGLGVNELYGGVLAAIFVFIWLIGGGVGYTKKTLSENWGDVPGTPWNFSNKLAILNYFAIVAAATAVSGSWVYFLLEGEGPARQAA